jgi:hypothetical protein
VLTLPARPALFHPSPACSHIKRFSRSVDVPITGLNNAPDKSIRDALQHAQQTCPELEPLLHPDDVDAIIKGFERHAQVLRALPLPRLDLPSPFFPAAVAHHASQKNLIGVDPHGLTSDEAGAIYACAARARCCCASAA